MVNRPKKKKHRTVLGRPSLAFDSIENSENGSNQPVEVLYFLPLFLR
jgi:hypothetical protein